ncbi:MAG: uroporphyrinogen-III synthase [Bacteroidota bacterium]
MQGRTILLTRDRAQSAEFESEVARRGGRVVCVPMIVITDPDSWRACDEALKGIDRYNGLVFTSINAVEKFIGRAEVKRVQGSTLNRLTTYVVGERTKAELEHHGLYAAIIPGDYSASALAKTLVESDVRDRQFLHPCGNLKREEIGVRIAELGGRVDEVMVYKTEGPDRNAAEAIVPLLKSGVVDVITFASPSAVKNYAGLLGTSRPDVRIAVIGHTTAEAMEELGWRPDIMATQSTMSGLLEAIDSFFE